MIQFYVAYSSHNLYLYMCATDIQYTCFEQYHARVAKTAKAVALIGLPYKVWPQKCTG